MSTRKTNQPGDAGAKNLAFTPAHPETGAAAQPTGQTADDQANNQQPQAAQGQSDAAGQQRQGQSSQPSVGGIVDSLEAKAKAWLG